MTKEEIDADYQAYLERRERALAARLTPSPLPARHLRSAPRDSRQYAPAMATTALRDDRLTPQAKALLVVLRARCGNGHHTDTTKATLANIMSRSTRSIQRYIAELVKFGYLRTKIREHPSGLYAGLRVWISEAVLPFFAATGPLAEWLAETTVDPEETNLSSINDSPKNLLLFPEISYTAARQAPP